MSLNSRFFRGITLAVAVGACATFAAAQESTQESPQQDGMTRQQKDGRGFGKRGFGRGMHRGGKGFGMRGLRGIELTDVQKEQIRGIYEANRPDEATMQEMRSLGEARRSGTLTAEQLERAKFLKEQRRAKGEMIQQQIMAVLTPDQVQQIEQRKQERKQRWEQRRQMREQNEKPIDN